MPTFSARLVVLVFVLLSAATCGPAPAKSEPQDVHLSFALYFAPAPEGDPDAELARLLAEKPRRLQLEGGTAADAVATITPRWEPIEKWPPPSPKLFGHVAVGLPMEAGAKLAGAKRVLVLLVKVPRSNVLLANRAVGALLADLAEATKGHVWDDETRQVFSRDRWRQDRVASWQDNLPNLSRHVTMHAYQNPELIRIITLGMRKFGLPDLVLTGIARGNTRASGNLINACMQRLVEGQRPERDRLVLVLADIRHKVARESALANPLEGAQGRMTLSFAATKPDEGDPENTLWKVDFPESKLKTETERAEWAMMRLFGSSDKVTNVQSGDPEMAAARALARQAFFAQSARFRKGLEVGEQLLVKAAFRGGGHTEYMWVEVTKWHEQEIEGVLANDPHYIKSLRPGARVTVKFEDVYDYLLRKPDGSVEGNETSKVLERRQ